jgi:ADP-ribose pyrophosphatase
MTDAPQIPPIPWKTLEKRVVYENGKWLTVENHLVELPDGRQIADWSWVQLPAYVNVAAVTEFGRWLCFQQPKYAIEGISLAPVGGYIEPSESSLAAAQRELLEETGHQASEWIALGQYAVDGNRGAGVAHFFLAKGATKIQEVKADDLETMELVTLQTSEVESALRAGAFKVLPWATVMALAVLLGRS